MARKKISQAMARMYQRNCAEMESILSRQRNRWASDFAPGWINIQSLTIDDASHARIATARLLKHAVVVQVDSGNIIRFYADKL